MSLGKPTPTPPRRGSLKTGLRIRTVHPPDASGGRGGQHIKQRQKGVGIRLGKPTPTSRRAGQALPGGDLKNRLKYTDDSSPPPEGNMVGST
jgi:hypothetical protein